MYYRSNKKTTITAPITAAATMTTTIDAPTRIIITIITTNARNKN